MGGRLRRPCFGASGSLVLVELTEAHRGSLSGGSMAQQVPFGTSPALRAAPWLGSLRVPPRSQWPPVLVRT